VVFKVCLMQHCTINNKFTASRVFRLFATIAVSAMTVSAAADNSIHQQLPHYSLQLAGGQSNPWVLPQAPENTPGFQRSPYDRYQQYPGNQADTQYPGYRFVTPEILESLKQQQMQMQQVPGNHSNHQYRLQPSMPLQPGPGQPVQDYYGYPPGGGMGFSNPLYDAPAVSPWGNGPDVLYQGESYPWIPDAAIGGIPPIPVQPWTKNNESRKLGNGSKQNENNVFNPFIFGPNGNL